MWCRLDGGDLMLSYDGLESCARRGRIFEGVRVALCLLMESVCTGGLQESGSWSAPSCALARLIVFLYVMPVTDGR